MNQRILTFGVALLLVFTGVPPLAYFLGGQADLNPVFIFAAIQSGAGMLITLGVPFTWLAIKSEKEQQSVFAGRKSKLVLVMATIVTAWVSAGMFVFDLAALPLILMFPLGLMGLFTRTGAGFASFIVPIIGWLSYLTISVTMLFTKNRQTARILYFILVALLIANVGGCTRLLSSAMGVEGW